MEHIMRSSCPSSLSNAPTSCPSSLSNAPTRERLPQEQEHEQGEAYCCSVVASESHRLPSPKKRNSGTRHKATRILVCASAYIKDHLSLLLDEISDGDRCPLTTSTCEMHELLTTPLYDLASRERVFDILIVEAEFAAVAEDLLNSNECSIDTVIIALVDESDAEGAAAAAWCEARCHGVCPAPPSQRGLRQALHMLMPRQQQEHPLLQPRAMPWLSGSGSDGSRRGGSAATAQPLLARVLQVEPCAVTANAMELQLAELGLWLDTARDGATAMTMLESRPYALVLTEHDLPGGLSGCALASWYTTTPRAVGRTRAPVVVISADAPEPDYEQFGVDSWLQRPLSPACIAEMLCAACITGARAMAHMMRHLESRCYTHNMNLDVSAKEWGCI